MNSVTEQNTDDAESLWDVIQNVTPQSKMASLSESLLWISKPSDKIQLHIL